MAPAVTCLLIRPGRPSLPIVSCAPRPISRHRFQSASVGLVSAKLFEPIPKKSGGRAGATAPHSSDSLLRAAEPAATRTAPDMLLRPAHAAHTGMTPVQRLFFASEEADEPEETQPLRR